MPVDAYLFHLEYGPPLGIALKFGQQPREQISIHALASHLEPRVTNVKNRPLGSRSHGKQKHAPPIREMRPEAVSRYLWALQAVSEQEPLA